MEASSIMNDYATKTHDSLGRKLLVDPTTRFWSKVDRRGPDECWEWKAHINRYGYGRIGWANNKVEIAHRIAWLLTRGRWPKDAILHSCDNPACCNPAHLFEGTQAENLIDMRKKGRGIVPPGRKGEANGMSKLTDEAIQNIRLLYKTEDYSQRDIARVFGVTQTTIGSIVRRETWVHIQ